MAKYKYGQNELDLQNLITNLGNNVDSYVQSKTDWSQAQKESFKEGYRDYIAGLQDQLANNTDRFSADEFGTITDKEGKLKDNTNTDYIYNKKGELLDPETTSKHKLKKGTPFYRNQELAIFNNIIAKGMVDKMNEQQKDIPSLADYWQQQYNPKGDLADYSAVAALDKEGEYTNRIAEIKGLYDNYKQKYKISPEQTAKYDVLINSLSTDNIGSDKWKNQIIRDSAAAGIGKFLTGYLGFNTPEPEKAFDINNDEDVIKRYQLEEKIKLYPELRDTLIANARADYNKDIKAALDQEEVNKKQIVQEEYKKKLAKYYKQNPGVYDVNLRNTENFGTGRFTTTSKLSDTFIDPLKTDQWNSNILNALNSANRTGDYFYTKFKNPIKTSTGHTIKNLGEFYAYLFPLLEQRGWLSDFDVKQDKKGNTVYRLKNSKNKAGEWLYMFRGKDNKLRTYRSKSYQDLLPKAQLGIKLDSYASQQQKQQTAATKARAKATGKTYQQQKAADSTIQWSGADKARLAGVIADIASIPAAYIPGYGTAISAAAGLGSTAANLGADLSDGTMSTWDAFKNAGINVGFDALGLFGGVGKGGKIAKTLVRYVPRILAAIGTVQGLKNAPEITASFKKLTNNGFSSLTVQDWQNISQGIGIATGIGGGAVRKIRQHNNTIQGNKIGVRFKDKATGESKIFTFEGNDAKAIRNAKNNAEIKAITDKYKELKGFELQHVNKLSGLHWRGIKDSNTNKYQLPTTLQSQKTQLYDVYNNGKTTWTNKEGIRGWLQPYGGQTVSAKQNLLSNDSKLSNKILSSTGSAIDSFGQAMRMASHNNQGVTGLPAIIGTPTPYKPYQGDFGFLDKKIATLQRQNEQRRNVVMNIDDSINRRQKQLKEQQMQNTSTALNKAFAESFSGQIPTTLSATQRRHRKEIRETFAKDTGQKSAEAIKRANDVLNAIIYNKSRTQLAVVPKLQFNLPPVVPYKFKIPNQYNGTPPFAWNNKLALPTPQVKKVETSKKSKLNKAKNKIYKQGGIIKAQTGVKIPWYNALKAVNKDTDFTSKLDTSTLYAGDTSKGLIAPWASNQVGNAAGRYSPTTGYTREQAKAIEEKDQLYKDFENKIFNADGTFNKNGEDWSREVDKFIPQGSTASFHDPKTGKLRTQWVTTNNDIYGRPSKTYTNLRDYVRSVRNDNIIGARHNIFINKGKRYFYKDDSGNKVYVNPQDLSKYKVSDKGNDIFENGTLWSDYELTGLAPEAGKTTAGTPSNSIKNPSIDFENLVNSVSPTRTYGLIRAILADKNNREMLKASYTQPYLIDPMEIHRNIYSDLGAEMQGQKEAAALQRLATTQAGADFDRNAAMALDAKLKGIELKDLKFKASNDLERQTAEASWAQEKENKQSRWQTANSNKQAIYENDMANLQRKLATKAQNFQIWDTYRQQLEQEAATDWQANRARMDTMAENDITNAIRHNISGYIPNLSPQDVQLWNDVQSGKKSTSTMTTAEQARFRMISEQANQAKYDELRKYYRMPKNQYRWAIQSMPFTPTISKNGGKLQVARLKAATADADRFYKTTKDFADRTERAIARLTTKKKKKKQ